MPSVFADSNLGRIFKITSLVPEEGAAGSTNLPPSGSYKGQEC